MKVSAAVLCILLLSTQSVQADIVYANDFDGNTQFASGTTVAISGGTGTAPDGLVGGITSTQGFNAFTGFGGDFWRVTAPDDVLEFDISNIPTHDLVSSGGIGSGFQGGNDESFAIDQLLITATPEPTSLSYLLVAAVATATRRRRRPA